MSIFVTKMMRNNYRRLTSPPASFSCNIRKNLPEFVVHGVIIASEKRMYSTSKFMFKLYPGKPDESNVNHNIIAQQKYSNGQIMKYEIHVEKFLSILENKDEIINSRRENNQHIKKCKIVENPIQRLYHNYVDVLQYFLPKGYPQSVASGNSMHHLYLLYLPINCTLLSI